MTLAILLAGFWNFELVDGFGRDLVAGNIIGDTIEAFNLREVRLAQAQAVFSVLGLVMLFWGAIEFGFLQRLVERISPITRSFFAQPTTRAGLMGVLVGLFMVGRPYPVFRDFLTYAAETHSPFYGAVTMTVQGLGQIAVMTLLFLLLISGFGAPLRRWMTAKPSQTALISAISLSAGGMYLLYYWGIALTWDLGRWGFKLGWY